MLIGMKKQLFFYMKTMKVQSGIKKPYTLLLIVLFIILFSGCKTCKCPSYSEI